MLGGRSYDAAHLAETLRSQFDHLHVESPAVPGLRLCRLCDVDSASRFDLAEDGSDAAVLRHYAEEHAESELFAELLENVWMEAVCQHCRQSFFSPVNSTLRGIYCRAYCVSCREEKPIRQIYESAVDAEELLEWQANPLTDELTRGEQCVPA